VQLLVLDPSPLLPLVVRRDLPAEVEVERVASYREALSILRRRPPDAVLVSVPPATIPWPAFQRLCASRRPPVPVLYESCLHESPAELGIAADDGYAALLHKPASRAAQRAALRRLLAEAERARQTLAPLH
jgi:DNA-binding response OmpR family regulator